MLEFIKTVNVNLPHANDSRECLQLKPRFEPAYSVSRYETRDEIMQRDGTDIDDQKSPFGA